MDCFIKRLHKENLLLILLPLFIYTNLFRLTSGIYTTEIYYDGLSKLKVLILIIYLIIVCLNIIRGTYDLLSILFVIVGLFTSFYINVHFELDNFNFENIQRDMGFELFSYVLLNLVYKDVNYRKIIKVVFITFLTLNSAVIFMVLYNFAYNIISFRNSVPRYSLGFLWSAHLSYSFFYIIIYNIYLKKNDISILNIAILFLLNFVIFYLTDTKHSFFLNLLILLFSFANIKINNGIKYKKIYGYILLSIILMLPLAFLIFSIVYNPENVFMNFANNLLSGRLRLTQEAIINEGISIMPHFIEYSSSTTNYNVVDSSIIRYMLNYGIVGFGILMFGLIYFAYLIHKNKDMILAVLFLASIIHMTFNVDLFTMSYNYLILVWSYRNTFIINNDNFVELSSINSIKAK